MELEEIKQGLEKLTKDELIKTFPSLELKPSEKKAFIIEAILTAEPSEDEKEAFKELLAKKTEDEPDKTEDEPVYIVVHQIKEDGRLYEIGDEYKGKFVDRFLGEQIRKRDK